MTAIGTRRTFPWATIEQPGEFYLIAGPYLIEDAGEVDIYWRIIQDVPGGLYCQLEAYSQR